jgi:hypothetical protein
VTGKGYDPTCLVVVGGVVELAGALVVGATVPGADVVDGGASVVGVVVAAVVATMGAGVVVGSAVSSPLHAAHAISTAVRMLNERFMG